MELNFIDSDNIRKLYIIKNLFGGMPEYMTAYPQIFGDKFATGCYIYNELRKPSPATNNTKEAEMEVISAILAGGNINKRLAALGKSGLIESLNLFDVSDGKCQQVSDFKNRLIKSLNNYANEIETFFRATFGFELPKILNVVVCEGFSSQWVKGQIMLMNEPVLLGLTYYEKEDNADAFGIAMHELLHALIYDHKSIRYGGEKGAGTFEEALLRVFLPHGVYGNVIGIQNSGIERGGEEAKRVYPEAADLAAEVKQYMEALPEKRETIWKFLTTTKFAKFVNLQ